MHKFPPLLLALTALSATPAARAQEKAPSPAKPKAAEADAFKPDPAWKSLGPSLWFDPNPKARRLVVRAKVVLREGPLEHFLCLKGTKEHEAILATGAVPRQIHAGLILTGANPGHPVQFLPKFEPPTGTPVSIEIEWEDGGKLKTADAREWVFDERGKKPLNKDWVFAGSALLEDPTTKKPYYAADDGDLVTVANFASSILDLPFSSTSNDAERSYVARTDQIPPRGTFVTLYLTPRKGAAGPPDAPKR